MCSCCHVMKQVEKFSDKISNTFPHSSVLSREGGEGEWGGRRKRKIFYFFHFPSFESTLTFRTVLEQAARTSDDTH